MDAGSQIGERARERRERNWLLKLALFVLSGALVAFGALGWADAANLFPVLQKVEGATLDPLWPFYATAGVGCLAAQFLAACAVTNLDRLSKDKLFWRGVAALLYAVSVAFAAYSADRGATVVLTAGHRAAYEANEQRREELRSEIAYLDDVIRREREKLPDDPQNTLTSRQNAALAIFEVSTKTERDRLPEAREELARLPDLPKEAPVDELVAYTVFALFLAWAILEPWGYALAERGRTFRPQPQRQPEGPPRQPFEVVEGGLTNQRPEPAQPTRSASTKRRLNLFGALLAALGIGLGGQHSQPAQASPLPNLEPVERAVAPLRENELAAIANRLAAEKWSERKIANHLSARANQPITRHRVRVWLGREADRSAA